MNVRADEGVDVRHPTVELSCPPYRVEGEEGLHDTIAIDEDLAPLIAALWSLGISTEQCCQEEELGIATVTFSDTNDLCDFLELAGWQVPTRLEVWNDAEPGKSPAFSCRLIALIPRGLLDDLTERAQAEAAE